ncbi:unnamed protein product [Paramecium octaurelia]|uniref:Uncharacterized protein n=1 Tax=Paramecium octaurelia TaxID=43137 RepID=A0A8S1WJ36_PAROT|nr:unnamed protein product [Paramecium octaurelia]
MSVIINVTQHIKICIKKIVFNLDCKVCFEIVVVHQAFILDTINGGTYLECLRGFYMVNSNSCQPCNQICNKIRLLNKILVFINIFCSYL